ncbi:MAG: ABC transporter ATP-binding protein, partial [Actinobacteria bacterium]|nr:ABC transporter ATP-binding protein [Actinomycetota bacterium]
GRVVESGPVEAVVQRTRHPYTRGLLDALPHPESTAGRPLVPIAGTPATPQERPPGCAFHPRCRHAGPACAGPVPPLVEREAGHLSACPVDPLAPVDQGREQPVPA